MRKLRQGMDSLLKTSRLMCSVLRLQQVKMVMMTMTNVMVMVMVMVMPIFEQSNRWIGEQVIGKLYLKSNHNTLCYKYWWRWCLLMWILMTKMMEMIITTLRWRRQ